MLGVPIAALVFGGCLDILSPDLGDRTVPRCEPADSDPDRDVSLSVDVLPLFERSRDDGGCVCHDPEDPDPTGFLRSGLDLTTYDAILRGGMRSADDNVVAGDPCISILFLKTGVSPPFGSRMPRSGPPYLTSSEQMLLHDWIAEGAHDN